MRLGLLSEVIMFMSDHKGKEVHPMMVAHHSLQYVTQFIVQVKLTKLHGLELMVICHESICAWYQNWCCFT